jgi:hypothetical protein
MSTREAVKIYIIVVKLMQPGFANPPLEPTKDLNLLCTIQTIRTPAKHAKSSMQRREKSYASLRARI